VLGLVFEFLHLVFLTLSLSVFSTFRVLTLFTSFLYSEIFDGPDDEASSFRPRGRAI